MIASAKLDIILGAITPRIFYGNRLPFAAFDDDNPIDDTPAEAYRIRSGVGIIPVHGTLVRRGGWLNSMSGLTSYEGLLASFREAMADADVKAVLLDIDSSGGEAGGVFDLVEELRRLSAKHNKPIWAHANEEAASAAYAIACAAEQIWVARTGDVGSIGVVCAHIDQSKYDEKQGLKWTFIYCGEHKTHGNPHEPLEDILNLPCQLINNFCPFFAAMIAINRHRHDTAAQAKILVLGPFQPLGLRINADCGQIIGK